MNSSLLGKWQIENPKLLVETKTSAVYLVQFQGQPTVLKLLNSFGQRFEGEAPAALRYFNGNGAVQLLQADDEAQLLEYLDGPSLAEISKNGGDKEAAEIICEVVKQLHSIDGARPKKLKTLEENFQILLIKAKEAESDPILSDASLVARKLISTQTDILVLHGDIHHHNIMQSSNRGWLAIDPQCLLGERTYDLANLFFNPFDCFDIVENSERIQLYCDVFADKLNLDPLRILEFAFAYGCLSACWEIEDGENPGRRIRISKLIRDLI